MQILLDKQFDYATRQSPFKKRWVQTARWSFSATIYGERNMKAVRNELRGPAVIIYSPSFYKWVRMAPGRHRTTKRGIGVFQSPHR